MKKIVVIIPFLLASAFVYAQHSRDEIKIYIPTPTGGNSTQQAYFQKNFSMEIAGAGYVVTEYSRESDYTLNLIIKPNMIEYDDGTQELAPPDEPRYSLELVLTATQTSAEIVRFSFLFSELDEMNEYNLFLIYEAMANVPLTKETGIVDDERWRNKWLYLRLSLDFNIPVYHPDQTHYYIYEDNNTDKPHAIFPIHQYVPYGPGLSLGVELHFLNWMSAELGFLVLAGNVKGVTYTRDPVGTFDLSVKFPLKPAKHYMIEPFAGIALSMSLAETYVPPFGVQGGVQIATKAGNMGGFFINIRGEYDFGKAYTQPPQEHATNKGATKDIEEIGWTRFVIGFSAGYKLGIADRKKK